MITKPIYILFILLIMWQLIGKAFAQETDQPMEVFELQDTIVVVADRFKLPLKDITYTYEIISKRQVDEFSKYSALELIDIAFPSAFTLDKKIIGYGVGPDGAGAINMRGQGGTPNTGVLVLLNGHPDFMGLFGHPLPDVYGMDDVQQVEILAGPASSVFGSQAMGGVINIKTGPDYDRLAKISLEGGSHNTYNLGINIAKKLDAHGLFFTARHNHTDGHIEKSSFESYHFQAGWQFQINPVWKVSLMGRYVPYQFDDPARQADPANLGTYAKIRRGTGELILENSGSFLSGSTQIYSNWGHHRFYDGFESRDNTYGISSYQQHQPIKDLNIAFGGDLLSYGGRAENTIIPPGIINEESHQITSAGVYGLAMYNPFKVLSLKLGLRYQYNSLPIKKVSPVAGFNLIIVPGLHFYTNYQSGFRYPTLNELYLFPSSNSELTEESIRSIESGLGFYWAKINTFRVAIFQNDVDNIIQTIANPTSPPPVKYVNSGQAKQMGVETQINLNVLDNLDLQFSYSFLDPDHLTAFNPKHQLKYILSFVKSGFRSTFYGKYVDHLYVDNDQKSRLEDYNLVNLILSYSLGSWEIHLRLMNLLDRKYDVQIDYRAPRRYVLAGLDYYL
jgi:outer membrane cobalamin receptor